MTKKRTVSVVEETDQGLYVWQTNDQKWLGDDDGNFLTMPSRKGDEVKLRAFRLYATGLMKDMGVEANGAPLFLAGRRQLNDEQYEEQKMRQAAGLVPDPFDVGSMMSDLEYAKVHGS